MADIETTRTIFGVIGNVISLFIFLFPLPTFVKMYKAKAVQEFKPDSCLAAILYCCMWVFYGLPFIHPDSILVVTINAIGLVIEIFYICVFLSYSDWPKRRKILIVLFIEVVFFAVVVFITMTFLHTTKSRSMLIGILCIIFSMIMYSPPLIVMCTVIRTKSVRFMPFYVSLASFLNGTIWLTYALLIFDPYIAIPMGLGALTGAVQLILYATYYKSTKWNDRVAPYPAPEVQLSSNNNPPNIV